jgi:hypothetical protein
MQDKQKVTLYLPPGIHRQLKIKAAIDEESMSEIVEKAIDFYLKHPEKVEEIKSASYGRTHQVHTCPECESSLVIRNERLLSLKTQPTIVTEEYGLVPEKGSIPSTETAELVPC